MNRIEFGLKEGIIAKETAIEDYINIFNELIGLDDTEIAAIMKELNKVDLNFYYCDTGSKVTKKIKSILNVCLANKRDRINAKWSKICSSIRNLYWASANVIASWGVKKLLGEGIWEQSTTCFSNAGCNALSKKFIVINKRFRVLVLEIYEDGNCTGCGRCIVYFAGNREIYLTNFYYNGLTENNLLFFEAVRRLLGLDYITYKKFQVPLPIYLNGDGYMIKTKKAILPENHYKNQKQKCPKCGKSVLASEIKTDIDGNSINIGCSDDCLEVDCCCNCRQILRYGDAYHDNNNNAYCVDCLNRLLHYCDECDSYVVDEEYLGNGLCERCGFLCSACGNAFSDEDACMVNDNLYCSYCFNELYGYCETCGQHVSRNYLIDDNLCNECGFVCVECNGSYLLNMAVKDETGQLYCRDCFIDTFHREVA